MNAERLLRLADHLETVPPETFDLSTWKCSSFACAVGHAADIPKFAAAGFSVYNLPCYNGKTGRAAVFKFFGIGAETFKRLFLAESYGGASNHFPKPLSLVVADRIREMVAAENPVLQSAEVPLEALATFARNREAAWSRS